MGYRADNQNELCFFCNASAEWSCDRCDIPLCEVHNGEYCKLCNKEKEVLVASVKKGQSYLEPWLPHVKKAVGYTTVTLLLFWFMLISYSESYFRNMFFLCAYFSIAPTSLALWDTLTRLPWIQRRTKTFR